jgi:hypothetical protein
MRTKETKTGQVSLKMEEEIWQVISKAFKRHFDLDWPDMETYECALAKEIAEKLWKRNQTGERSLRLRQSEFHFIFCEAVMHYVPESHHSLINLAAEPFKHQVVHYRAIPAIRR